MSVPLKSFPDWIRLVYATQDEELDCNTLFESIARYVDFQMAGKRTNSHFVQIEHHLAQCPECYEMYQALCDSVLAEDQHSALRLLSHRLGNGRAVAKEIIEDL